MPQFWKHYTACIWQNVNKGFPQILWAQRWPKSWGHSLNRSAGSKQLWAELGKGKDCLQSICLGGGAQKSWRAVGGKITLVDNKNLAFIPHSRVPSLYFKTTSKSSPNISLPSTEKYYQAPTMCWVSTDHTDVATAHMKLPSNMGETQELT